MILLINVNLVKIINYNLGNVSLAQSVIDRGIEIDSALQMAIVDSANSEWYRFGTFEQYEIHLLFFYV